MIVIEPYRGFPVTGQRVEIVERKGIGHPDYLCDAMMESISIALCREYMKNFGIILHHNIDKGLLAAGSVEKRFGGGRVKRRMELIIGDRAAFSLRGRRLDVKEIAIDAAKDWLKRHMRFVDPDAHLKYRVVLGPGSEELTDIFNRPGRLKGANDTSAAVGYYPLSPTEKAVLDLERYLNSSGFKKKYPETGEDVKVMGLRTGDGLDITVAMPLLCNFVRSERDYFERKQVIYHDMLEYVSRLEGFREVRLYFNSLDVRGRGLGGVYLSLLGTSAEDADSGQVGRGNRVNGLISMNRPMGTEAAAGKNPVSHVGKIYNVLAHRIAQMIYEKIEGLEEVYVMLLSRIGSSIDRPQMATAQILLGPGRRLGDIKKAAEGIFEAELSGISKFCLDLSRGRYPVC